MFDPRRVPDDVPYAGSGPAGGAERQAPEGGACPDGFYSALYHKVRLIRIEHASPSWGPSALLGFCTRSSAAPAASL